MLIHADYRERLKQHFPPLLERIASARPEIIIFPDNSARPFAWLANKLWRAEWGSKPRFLFRSPPSLTAHYLEWQEFVKQLKADRRFAGKRVCVFDDTTAGGTTLDAFFWGLSGHAKEFIPAAFADPARSTAFSAVDELINSPFKFALSALDRTTPVASYRASKRSLAAADWKEIHAEINELAAEILRERRAREGSR
ncbi:MAG: hypothetical protein AABW54_01430 [Candidatus Micrarchaeota archaeon]